MGGGARKESREPMNALEMAAQVLDNEAPCEPGAARSTGCPIPSDTRSQPVQAAPDDSGTGAFLTL